MSVTHDRPPLSPEQKQAEAELDTLMPEVRDAAASLTYDFDQDRAELIRLHLTSSGIHYPDGGSRINYSPHITVPRRVWHRSLVDVQLVESDFHVTLWHGADNNLMAIN